MADVEATFEPITTQEQLNSIIGERLSRERETINKKYADYDDLKAKVSDYEKQLKDLSNSLDAATKKASAFDAEREELTSKILAYETNSAKMEIAREYGIPYELANRISGATREEIEADAKALAQILRSTSSVAPPLAEPEPVQVDGRSAVYGNLLKAFNLE